MSETTSSDFSLNRRNFLSTGGTLAAAAAAGVSLAGDRAAAATLGAAARRQLVTASLACVRTGKACLERSIAALKAGDTTLASCASRVQEMVLSCGALSRLAINGSRQVGPMVEAVREVAAECESECRKHVEHPPFRACAQSCADFVRQCRAVA